MKLNQFAIQPTSFQQEFTELQQINFIKADFLNQKPVSALQLLLQKSFPELTTPQEQLHQISTLMATSKLNALEYLQQKQVTATAFYNIYWQLLGFEAGQNFSLDDPLALDSQVNYPIFSQSNLATKDLIHGWYQLLITHTVHGQTFLDELANRGYFQKITQDPKTTRPLIFNGKAQPVFDTKKLIHEVVYVESSLDSDQDGKRDLLKTEIIRPQESNQKSVPALYTASPYNQGTNDKSGEELTHNVNVLLRAKKNTPNTVNFSPKQHSQIPKPRSIKGHSQQASESMGNYFSYSLNDYFLARGFAVVYAAGIGTKDSQGFRTCGDVQETASTTAIIEWLAGQRTAFSDQTQQISIKAWWCNQQIAMTGRSYLGTLAIAAATTGVNGLKTIIAEAAISSWYDYYRENGLVVAPKGFPGEDADVLAMETFSRKKQAGDYKKIESTWKQHLQKITKAQDRFTGNYNDFWEQRNYRHHLQKIKADIFLVHGLNDWNVKPKNAYKFWHALQKFPVTTKLILHQGPHIYINNFRSLDFTDIINLWLTHELYNIDNHAQNILPNIIIQDNATAETWKTQNTWGDVQNQSQVFYFNDNSLQQKPAPQDLAPQNYFDYLPSDKFNYYTKNLNQWQADLTKNNSDLATTRLLFKTAPQQKSLIIDGRPKVKLRIASDQPYGLLSCRLVDYGLFRRLDKLPQVLESQAFDLDWHYQKENLSEYQLTTKPTSFQLISLAHLNFQHRTGLTKITTVVPDKFYDMTLLLQPTHYRLLPGHQLGLIVYATDMEMTIRGNQNIHYQLDCTRSHLLLPLMS